MSEYTPGADRPDAARVFDEHRGLLTSVAYGVLGSMTDAEDAVQEAWLRWSNVDHSEINDPRAFLLREAFGMPHPEIAEILGRKEEAVRQLASRARAHVRERRSRFDADQGEKRRVTERFLEAAATGDLDGLMAVLSPGVELVADSGGRALAPRRPVRGAEKVARFLLAVVTEEKVARFLESVGSEPSDGTHVHMAQLNGAPGVVITAGGEPISALVLDVSDGTVRTIRLVANPEKLAGVRAVEVR